MKAAEMAEFIHFSRFHKFALRAGDSWEAPTPGCAALARGYMPPSLRD